MITVKTDKFQRFLNLLAIKGDIQNVEAVAHGDANALGVITVSANTVMALEGRLAGNFDQLGDIGLDNIQLLQKFAAMFTKQEEIELALKKNKLVMTAPKTATKASAVLRDAKLIKNIMPSTKFHTLVQGSVGNEFTLKKDVITEIIKHFEALGINKFTINDKFKLIGDGNILTLTVEHNENEILTTFNISETVQPFTVCLNQIFIDLLSVIDTDVVCSVKDKKPVYIKLEDKDIKFEYLLAPSKE